MLASLAKRTALGRAARFVPIYKVIAVAQLALLAREHVGRLEPGEGRRLTELVRRRRSLDEPERDELRALTAKLAPRAFAGAAADRLSPVPLPRRLTGVPRKR